MKKPNGVLLAGLNTHAHFRWGMLLVLFSAFITQSLEVAAQTNGSCVRPPTGIVGWWPLDGNTEPLLGVASGVPSNEPGFNPGYVDGGLYFHGSAGLSFQPLSRFSPQGFTAECWFWGHDPGNHQPLFVLSATNGLTLGTLALNSPSNSFSGTVWASFRGPDGISRSISSASGVFTTNGWHHIALVHSGVGSNATIYLDGAIVAQGFVGTVNPTFAFQRMRVGNYEEGGRGFVGTVDEISLYDRQLTSNQVASIFQAGSAGKCKNMLPPFVVQQPQTQSVPFGATATFSVTAQGTEPLTYRWRRNGAVIPGAPNSPVLEIVNVGSSNGGSYSVQITNAFGSAISSNAQLTVTSPEVPPSIVSFGPTSLTVTEGSTAQFSVTANGNPLNYQWFFNITALTNNGPTLVLPFVQPQQGGSYWVRVFNNSGSVTSTLATLTVISDPTNNPTPPTIVSQPQNQIVPLGASATFSVVAEGSPLLTYRWYRNSFPVANGSNSTLFIPTVGTNHVGNYFVAVRNPFGVVTSAIASLTLSAPTNQPGPTIVSFSPISLTVTQGGTAQFSVVASGVPPLSYQWLFNGVMITGAVDSVLHLVNIQRDEDGAYSVLVSDAFGRTAEGGPGDLTVINPPHNCAPLANGAVAWWKGEDSPADSVGGNHGILIGTTGYREGKVGRAFSIPPTNGGVRVPASSDLNVGAGSGFTVEGWISPESIHVTQPLVQWSLNNGSTRGVALFQQRTTLDVEFNLIVPDLDGASAIVTGSSSLQNTEWYHIAVTYERTNGRARIYANGIVLAERTIGTFVPDTRGDLLFGSNPHPEFNFASFRGRMDEMTVYRRALSPPEIWSIHQALADGKCQTNSPGLAPVIIAQPQNRVVPLGSSTSFSVTASGTAPLFYLWHRNGIPLTNGFNSTLFIPVVSASSVGQYFVTVSNPFGSVTSAVATLSLTGTTNVPTPPTILSQPQDRVVPLGSSTSFSLIATGSPPLAYRWHFNGTPVLGGTNSTLNIPLVTSNSVGGYFAVVSNPSGSVTSRVASLSIGTGTNNPVPPTIVTQPQNRIVPLGASTSFSVTATGTQPLSYRWHFNGNPTTNTSSTLFIPIVTTSSVGNYLVVVSNPFGSVTSQVATLTLSGGGTNNPAPPVIVVQPQDRVVPLGASTSFFLTVTGTPPFHHVWHFNGTPVQAGTNNVLNIPVVTSNSVGSYFAVVSNPFGSVTSRVATLTIGNSTNNPSTPPTILTQPQNRTAPLGGSATFSVTATGAPPLAYQWHFNGNPLTNGFNSTLIVSLVSSNSVGQYFVVVSNPFGSVTSSVATLTLTNTPPPSPPTIVSQPQNRTVVPGGTAFFSVTATGSPTLLYRWHFNSVPLAGATNRSLVISNVGPSSVGDYFVTVRNPFGSVTSVVATLTLSVPSNRPPNIAFTLSPLATLTPGQTELLVISPNNSNAPVVLNGSASSDPDGDLLQFFWFEGNAFSIGSGAIVTNAFLLGEHAVTLSISDGSLSVMQTKEFTVITAAEAVDVLVAQVENSGLPRRLKRPLLATLLWTARSFERGEFENGLNQLQAFCNKVETHIAPLDPVLAHALLQGCHAIEAAFE